MTDGIPVARPSIGEEERLAILAGHSSGRGAMETVIGIAEWVAVLVIIGAGATLVWIMWDLFFTSHR